MVEHPLDPERMDVLRSLKTGIHEAADVPQHTGKRHAVSCQRNELRLRHRGANRLRMGIGGDGDHHLFESSRTQRRRQGGPQACGTPPRL